MAKKTPKLVTHASGQQYPQRTIADEYVPTLVEHLTAHGYGVPAGRVEEIFLKLTPEDRADLLYVCYRAAEKLGPKSFSSDEFDS